MQTLLYDPGRSDSESQLMMSLIEWKKAVMNG